MSNTRFLPRLSLTLSLALLGACPALAAELTPDMPPEEVAREAYARMQAADWVAAVDRLNSALRRR